MFPPGRAEKSVRMQRELEDTSQPELRVANNADCEKVTSLVYGILAECGLKPDPPATDADIRDIEASYFEREGVFFVLDEESGSIIGAHGL